MAPLEKKIKLGFSLAKPPNNCEYLAILRGVKMQKQKSNHSISIAWAIDILATDKKVRNSAESLLKVLEKKTELSVHPLYVVRLAEQVEPFTHGEGKKVFLNNVGNAIKRWLKGLKVSTKEPQALLQKGVYLRSDVDALIGHAKKIKADLLLVNTHARKGFSRFWMGSFAETLMHHSTLPVLFLNPSAKPVQEIREIIFPTNLSLGAEKSLHLVCSFAKKIGAGVTLYNNVEYFVATPGLSFTETAVFTDQIAKDVKNRKKSLERQASKFSKAYGIKMKLVVDESDVRVSDGINSCAQKSPKSMIAMTSQTGPLLSVLVGSTTRRVVREAKVPVLVFRD